MFEKRFLSRENCLKATVDFRNNQSQLKMEFTKNFSVLALLIFASLVPTEACNETLSRLVSSAQMQVDTAEKQLIREQLDFKIQVSQAIKNTNATWNLLKSCKPLRKFNAILGTIASTLIKFNKPKNFNTSNFQKQNKLCCGGIEVMVPKLEGDMVCYLQSQKFLDFDASSLTQQTEILHTEYFTNLIYFTNATNEKTVMTIAILDKLFERSQVFSSVLYSTATQVANILYDLKVANTKNCDRANNKTKSSTTTRVQKTTNNDDDY